MKWFIGFFVLLIALVMISGCSQPAPTITPATTVPTTVAAAQTTAQVPVSTPLPTTVVTTKPATTVATTVPAAAQTTAQNSTLVVVKVPTVTPASGVTLIHITSTGFIPQTDVVLPGTAIWWINDDSVPHTVKVTNKNVVAYTSDTIQPNSQTNYDFGTEGTFSYALVDLPKINGTIIVKSGGGMTSYST